MGQSEIILLGENNNDYQNDKSKMDAKKCKSRIEQLILFVFKLTTDKLHDLNILAV